MLKALQERHAELCGQQKQILDRVAEEKRYDLTTDEQTAFDKLQADIEKLGENIKRHQQLLESERAAAEAQGRKIPPQRTARHRDEADDEAEDEDRGQRSSRAARHQEQATTALEALRGWLIAGSDRPPTSEQTRAAAALKVDLSRPRLHLNLRRQAPRSLREAEEARALDGPQSSDPIYPEQGAYTIPETMSRELEIALLRFGGMREVARIIRTAGGETFRIPTVNDTANKGRIIGENTARTAKGVEFGQANLGAYTYTSDLVLVPMELLQDSVVNLAQFLGEALGERIGRATNEHFTVGTGTGQPQGAVTGSTLGKQGTLAAEITYDELVDLEHSVDRAYRAGAVWMMHDKTLAILKKIRDGEDRLVWQQSLAVSSPGTILGYPYVVNNDMPEMGQTGKKSVLFGHFRKYWIRDVLGITLQRLDERFAEYGQVAFVANSRHDGALVDAGTGPIRHFANGAGS